MWFYGRLKGLSEAEVKAEMDTLLDDVGLLQKRHEQTKNLSGKLTGLTSVLKHDLTLLCVNLCEYKGGVNSLLMNYFLFQN